MSAGARLVVIPPSGSHSWTRLAPLPFYIGRNPDNHLIIRDNRASRHHARIVGQDGAYVIEDLKSRHGVFVNGRRVLRERLRHQDRITFGFPDSYQLVFLQDGAAQEVLGNLSSSVAGTGGSGRLRGLLDVARALRYSISAEDILAAVVDAALQLTGMERGFLLLEEQGRLTVSIARGAGGAPLSAGAFTAPLEEIYGKLCSRSELLSIHLAGPLGGAQSVICIPLVHIRGAAGEETRMVSTAMETAGALYLESEGRSGQEVGRELLESLALEASTILENARLLEEERKKQKLEEELAIAREIQTSLLPKRLPESGWLRAAGWSIPSREVGGDYFDLRAGADGAWAAMIADVSGKGVSSALVASLLQGAFVLAAEEALRPDHLMARLNGFLLERTQGEKYVTAVFCRIQPGGELECVNAGHCTPLVVRATGEIEILPASGPPVGLLEAAAFDVVKTELRPGDLVVMVTDGLTESTGDGKQMLGMEGIRAAVGVSGRTATEASEALRGAVEEFTQGAPQADDMTAFILEYRGLEQP